MTAADTAGTRRLVRVEQIMGTATSAHAILPADIDDDAEALEARFDICTRGCFDELRKMDRIFSPYRDDSDIFRLHDGGLSEAEAAE
ncbi:MAG: FAD:protein FMN transferase, partial [Actinobacteria bacterium]|nr:FAD:protein FMN transferase [Actinomycetota bacterium]